MRLTEEILKKFMVDREDIDKLRSYGLLGIPLEVVNDIEGLVPAGLSLFVGSTITQTENSYSITNKYGNVDSYVYDVDGKLSEVTETVFSGEGEPTTDTTKYKYGKHGVIDEQSDYYGISTWKYDDRGRTIEIYDGWDDRITKYEYDDRGRMISERTVASDWQYYKEWQYDDSGRVIKYDDHGRVYLYEYDPDGRLLRKYNRGGLGRGISLL